MANISLLQSLLENRSIGRTLKVGTSARDAVMVLQELLYELGHGKALKWDRSGPDGDYGASTVRAVKTFAKNNGIDVDGSSISAKLGRLLIQRHAFLDEMHHMQDAVNNASILKQLHYKSRAKVAVTVLQDILHELGFDEEMDWAKYGADGEYGKGTTAAVKAFAIRNGLDSDGKRVTLEMAKKSLESFLGYYGPDWYKESPKLVRQSLKITETSKHVTVADGVHTSKFRKFKLGYYNYGSVKTADFIDANRAELKHLGMTDSALNVMLGVSENEGNLDAINTWDNAIMTFGMFQWTIGVNNAKGELPALFRKIKDADPDVFDRYYGQYGLDIWNKTTGTHGHLVLNGQIINTTSEKAQFRKPKWCFYFWKAGQDPLVQAISLQHAFSRIGTFARSPACQVNGHDVADIVTSEYGMALVLDNHVNRPGYIKGCLTMAMNAVGLKNTDPVDWTTADERKLIDRYVAIRETYGNSPMTDARKRARVTKRYLAKGIISGERHSFEF